MIATTDKDEILALGADVLMHAASKAHAIETNAEDICRLLAAGSTVITHDVLQPPPHLRRRH